MCNFDTSFTAQEEVDILYFLGEVINGNEDFCDVLRQCITQELDEQIVAELRKEYQTRK